MQSTDFDQNNDRHVEINAKFEKERREGELRDIRAVLQTEAGRRVFWRLMSLAGIFRNPFTGNNETFFNCGKQEIGQRIMADLIEAKPDAFAQMQNEEKVRADVERVRFLKEIKHVRE